MDEAQATAPFGEAFDIGRGLAHGWASLRRCFPVLFVGGCLRACTEGGGGSGGGNDFGGGDHSGHHAFFGAAHEAYAGLADGLHASGTPFDAVGGLDAAFGSLGAGVIAALVVGVLVVLTFFLVFVAWFEGGWLRVHEEIVRTGEGTFGTLFSGADVLLPILGNFLLAGFVFLGVFGLAAGPGFAAVAWGVHADSLPIGIVGGAEVLLVGLPVVVYVVLGLSFVHHLVALDGYGPVDALSRSWALASGHRLQLLFFRVVVAIVTTIAGALGIVACFVGVFVTWPAHFAVRDLAFTEAYLYLTRPTEEREAWSIWSWAA